MPALSTWNLDQTRLLTRRELAAVLADLAPRAALSFARMIFQGVLRP